MEILISQESMEIQNMKYLRKELCVPLFLSQSKLQEITTFYLKSFHFMYIAVSTKVKEIALHPSFHGSITKNEAQGKLRNANKDCYLTRYDWDLNKCVISTLMRSEAGKEIFGHFYLPAVDRGTQELCSSICMHAAITN